MFRKSIRNKLIILLLVATIIPFGSSIIITYYHTKESIKNQVVQENMNLLYQGKVNLQSYLTELNGLPLSLYNNPEFMTFMKSSQKETNYFNVGTVNNLLQTILYAEDNIDRVYISFLENNRFISISKRSTVVFSSDIKESYLEYYKKTYESPYNMYIEPMHYQSGDETMVKSKPKQVFSLHRAFINVPSNEILAYISLEVSPDEIIKLSENLYNKDREEFYILSPQGELIYSSNVKVSGNEENQEWISSLLTGQSESGSKEWKEDHFHGVMLYNKMEDSAGGWILVKRIPYSTLYESAFSVAKINILFGILGMVLVILATLFVTVKITSPIRILLQNIQQVEDGNMKVQFSSLGSKEDEIGILGDRFKGMIEKINLLINREYKLELENKTNQLKVLQSQINPHFLYNALQSIGTLALKNNVPQIYSLITHLSKIMRYGMNTDESLVPLIKEINYTKAYLLLQKERFGEHLDYVIEVDESVHHVQVPKMVIQPIIENYFKHGFDIRDGIGKIRLKCKEVDGFLEIRVRDNGIGISEERLFEIYKHFEDERRSTDGGESNIGLKNVYVRLKLYYDGGADLHLENREEGGLLVAMKLPINSGGGLNEGDHH
ncbi:cache domain-containing sensor histidine kinase [Litchfieldia salsa]|uniref:histidine kinase n=1 Tax=Litchfieldia salsa TaxID=930152 RepID=A0A1H0VR77_9BACI|nr:sensor histidine kinase [Litchfieldia salsa]SDP80960.1 two-component system, sensor histidine kinase YesM [Litchfieldia salsa]